MEERPKVGIGVLIFKEGKILLGKRKGAHGEGVYAGPGGHLEYLESFSECAQRETREEAGIEIENIRFLALTNLQTYAPKHYIDIGIVADWKSGEPMVLEKEKCEGWGWYDPENLPGPVFASVQNYLETLSSGKHYFDSV